MAFDLIAHETPSSEEHRIAPGTEHVITKGQSYNFALLAERSPSSPRMTETGDDRELRHYHKVDLAVLRDLPIWDSLISHHSYADLDVILTLLCRLHGLAYSQGGFKVRDDSHCQQRVQQVYFS